MVAESSSPTKWINILAFVLTVIVNSIAGSTTILGRKLTAEISDANPTLITPAGYVFSIWGIIYILLGAFVVFRARCLLISIRIIPSWIFPIFVCSNHRLRRWLFRQKTASNLKLRRLLWFHSWRGVYNNHVWSLLLIRMLFLMGFVAYPIHVRTIRHNEFQSRNNIRPSRKILRQFALWCNRSYAPIFRTSILQLRYSYPCRCFSRIIFQPPIIPVIFKKTQEGFWPKRAVIYTLAHGMALVALVRLVIWKLVMSRYLNLAKVI